MTTLRTVVGSALYVQVAWAVLSAIWNVGGVAMIARGLRAPGPTASLVAAAMLLVIAAAMLISVAR